MWTGSRGLADDVRYYGQWMRDRAFERIGQLYPKVKLPKEHGGGEATVMAWIWARIVECPNPACLASMPLVSSFALSNKPGKRAWVEPVVDHASRTIRFTVSTGTGSVPDSPKLGRGAKFRCIVCGQSAPDQHIKDEGTKGRIGQQLLALVVEGNRERLFLEPTLEQVDIACHILQEKGLEEELAHEPRAIWCTLYGLTRFRDLFTSRQLKTLNALSDLESVTK